MEDREYLKELEDYFNQVGSFSALVFFWAFAMVIESLWCWELPPFWGWVVAVFVGIMAAGFVRFFSFVLVFAQYLKALGDCEEEEEEVRPQPRSLPVGQPIREQSPFAMQAVGYAAPILITDIEKEFGDEIDLDGILSYIGNKITDEEKSLAQRKDMITTSRSFYVTYKFMSERMYKKFRPWMIENGYFKQEGNITSPTDKLLNLAADYVQ